MDKVFDLDHRPGYFDVQEPAAVAKLDKVRALELKEVILFRDNCRVADGPVRDVFYKALSQAAGFPDTGKITVKDAVSRVSPVAVSVDLYCRR